MIFIFMLLAFGFLYNLSFFFSLRSEHDEGKNETEQNGNWESLLYCELVHLKNISKTFFVFFLAFLLS